MVGALRTIVVADVVMSMDNILAIAGVSHGSFPLLLFGLLLSMPPILFGSGLVASLMNRFPGLGLIGSGILAWTGGKMMLEDNLVGGGLRYPGMQSLLHQLLMRATRKARATAPSPTRSNLFR